jgi:hypothetical protein
VVEEVLVGAVEDPVKGAVGTGSSVRRDGGAVVAGDVGEEEDDEDVVLLPSSVVATSGVPGPRVGLVVLVVGQVPVPASRIVTVVVGAPVVLGVTLARTVVFVALVAAAVLILAWVGRATVLPLAPSESPLLLRARRAPGTEGPVLSLSQALAATAIWSAGAVLLCAAGVAPC